MRIQTLPLPAKLAVAILRVALTWIGASMLSGSALELSALLFLLAGYVTVVALFVGGRWLFYRAAGEPFELR